MQKISPLNAQSRNRTSDTRIFSPLLYQLSYLGISSFVQQFILYCPCRLVNLYFPNTYSLLRDIFYVELKY